MVVSLFLDGLWLHVLVCAGGIGLSVAAHKLRLTACPSKCMHMRVKHVLGVLACWSIEAKMSP